MTDIDSLAAALFGSKRAESQEVLTDATTRTYVGTALTDSKDGTVMVDLGGDVTLPDDVDDVSEHSADGIEVSTSPSVRAGDEVVVTLVGGTPLKTPMVTGVAGEGDGQNERIHAIEADYVKATTLEADVAEIGFLKADSATIADLQADTAKVHDLTAAQLAAATGYVGELQAGSVSAQDIVAGKATVGELAADHVSVSDLDAATARIGDLEADHVSVSDFQAEQASIDSLQAATADIDTIRANSAKVQNLTAAQLEADHATIGTLDTTYATIANLNAANGRITNLESTKANISDLEADYITADEIEATYMHANMSNSDVAWISNGTIKDGAITNAMINSVSANKLTAGTIDASEITVTNLNADNITTGTINGQRIGEGSLSLDKLSEDVYTEAEVDTIVDGLNDRIDGAIETHTGTAVPTLNNQPASSWNTTKLRDEHVGDVYYVVNSQSQQNGYCYRFTKSGSTYSWQLIKDSDVTAALSRLTTAEGKITTFDSDISKLKTDTGTLTTKTESLETRMSDAESDILDKVDTTTFNEVSDTVDQHSQTLSQHTTAISNKADSSTVTAVTNRVSKNEQDISGINTSIGELQETVETKADGSTVSTISNKLNTVSDTVDGHTQTLTSVQNTLSTKADSSTVSTLTTKVNNVSDTVDGHTSQLSSITTTQTTMQTALDKTVKSSIQLWYSKANTTAPNKPTSQVTSTSTNGNAWRIVVPAYNSSYPHYFYCWQYEYVDGTYGWSAVVRDIAMGESQSTARTADSNASAAVTTANTANTNASTALTTANTANTNASDAKTAAATASTNASEAKTTAETAASDASTAKTTAASAVTTANSASTTATNAKNTANANIKSSVQLWFTKANSTAPNKPTSVVSTSNANTANAWNLVVPVWNKSYPHYFYCYQQQKGDGNYQWTDVVYDRATSEAQQLANTTSTNLSTLQEDYATYKQTTTENVSSIGTRLTTAEGKISTAETSISQNADAIALRATKTEVQQVRPAYASSSTAAGTAAKVATIDPAVTGYALYKGASVAVTFSTANTAATPTLNLNSTGAKQIRSYTGAALSEAEYKWAAGATIDLVYDGTYWRMQDGGSVKRVTAAEASIKVNADNIESKVSKDGVISSINQSAETVKIQASRVEIDGTAVFNNSAFQKQLTSSYSKTIAYTYNNSGQGTGYAKLANITAKAAYLNLPITFTLYRRGQAAASNVTVTFANGSPTDTLSQAYYDGQLSLYYVRVGTGSYDIYIALGESWDIVKVANFVNPYTSSNMEVTWAGEYYGTSLPSGAVAFTRLIGQESKASYDSAIASAEANAKAYADTTKIGGRNLIPWSALSGTYVSAYDKASNGYAIVIPASTSLVTKASGNIFDRISSGLLSIGGQATLSFTAVATGSTNLRCDFSPDTYTGAFANVISPVTTTPKRYTITGKIENDSSPTSLRVRFWRLASDANYAITIWDIKLESGTHATDWSPAPEDLVTRTQRIWYRTNGSSAPATPGTASSNWVTKADDGNDAWTKMHVAISSTHKYIYTCEQYEMANGTVGYTDVLLDNTITVIDGGNIITGSVNANAISASSGAFDVANIPNLSAAKITSGTIDAARIDASQLTIGQSQVTGLTTALNGKADTSDIPTNVSDLTNDSGFQTSSQVESAITGKGYQTSSQVESAITSKGYQTSSQVNTAITSKGYQTSTQVESAITSKGYATTTQAQGYATTAKSEAISAAATDATTKANAAETNAKNDTTSRLNAMGTDNKVVNGAFVNGTDNWSAWGTPTTRNRVQVNGKWWMHCVTTATQYQGYSQNHYTTLGVTVEPSTTYTVGITARGAAANTKVCVGFQWFAPSGTSIVSQSWLTFTVSTTAARQYQTVTVPSGIDHFNVMVGQSTAPAQEFWITDVTLVKGTVNQEWSESSALAGQASITANAAAPKANAVKRTQRIWYRKSASGAPSTPGTASSNWVTKADDGNDAWTKMHIAINSTHKHIYTCEQYEMANGTVGYTSVLLDNTITVIDGGNIITGSVTANKLNAADINASKTLTVGAMTDAAASTILNSNVVVGGRNLFADSKALSTAKWTFDQGATRGDNLATLAANTSSRIYQSPANGYWSWKPNTEYVISVEAKASASGGKMTFYMIGAGGNTLKTVDLTTSWARYSWAFTSSATVSTGSASIFNSTNTGTVQVRLPKLEEGNKATDWTPAPEDMATAESLAGTNESLEGAITDIGELSDQLVGTVTEQNQTITDIQTYLNSLRKDLDAEIQSRQQWLNFNSAEGLVIGAAGSSFKTVTTNTSQQFRSGGTVLAETSGTEFVAPVMRSDQLLIGNWMWTRRDNGNLSLKWIG